MATEKDKVTNQESKEHQKEPTESFRENKELAKRIIVGFNTVSSIKKLLFDEASDETTAIEKIIIKCVNDFVLKCSNLLDDTTEIPSTAYTYVRFMERFAWTQQEDATTLEGTKNFIFNDPTFIVDKIVSLYKFKHRYVLDEDELNSYFDSDLIHGDKAAASKKIMNMFGTNLFPCLSIWYNYSDTAKCWQYVYTIEAPQSISKEINTKS